MQARILAAGYGVRWLTEGWRMFRAAPLGWLALVFAYWLLMTFISLIPLAGVAIASIAVPAFSVGFMAAARAAAGIGKSGAGKLELALLFEGFRQNPRAQLVLGLAYLACLVLVLAASSLLDGGALARWMLSGQRPGEDVLQSGEFQTALAAAAALYAPVMMLFWFAPPLVSWHSASAPKALFFSFFACLMNWRAFLAYGAVTALVALVVPLVLLTGLMLASGGRLQLPVVGLIFPLLVVLLPTLFASFYASYRDVFGPDEIL